MPIANVCHPSINSASFFMKYNELGDLTRTRMRQDCIQTNEQSCIYVTIDVSSNYCKKDIIQSKRPIFPSMETESTLNVL